MGHLFKNIVKSNWKTYYKYHNCTLVDKIVLGSLKGERFVMSNLEPLVAYIFVL